MRIKRLDKKGVLGMDTAMAFVIAILTLGMIAFAAIVVLSSLTTNSGLDQTLTPYNQTVSVQQNITGGITSFFGNAGTWFALLAIVVIILIVVLVIVAVRRFGSREGGAL